MKRRGRLKVMKVNGVVKPVLIPDDRGRITIPKEILERFKGCGFSIEEIDGKIVLDPVKLDNG